MRAVGSGTRHSACSRAPVAGPLTRRSRIVPRWIAMPLYGRGLPSTSCLVVGGCSMKLHRFAARSRRAKFCRASRLVCLLPVAMANLRASGSPRQPRRQEGRYCQRKAFLPGCGQRLRHSFGTAAIHAISNPRVNHGRWPANRPAAQFQRTRKFGRITPYHLIDGAF